MKRKWFQIHLSTAIIMMLASSVLLWVNLLPREQFLDFIPIPPKQGMTFSITSERISYGWPQRCFDYYTPEYQFWSSRNLCIDCGTAIGVVLVVAFCCENVIRRREVRKP
jgi:hypothetical protein